MNTETTEELLERLSTCVAERLGLHFPPERRTDLERGLKRAAVEFGFDDAQSCANWLVETPLTRSQIETLAGHLTVGETYFFRDSWAFQALEEQILPPLIQSRRNSDRHLRIWSAGCSTGEEPYSVSILLRRLIPDIEEWNISILATDINPSSLRKAIEGVYREWSFRNVPAWVIDGYFTRGAKNALRLSPKIRRTVAFRYHNLAEDSYPSLANLTNGMDLILCRNVLMYFTEERQRAVLQKMHISLTNGGWLMVGPAESFAASASPLKPVQFNGVSFYRNAVSTPGPQALPLVQQTITLPGFSPAEKARETAASGFEKGNARGPARFAEQSRDHADRGLLVEARSFCEQAIASEKLNPAHHYLLSTILQEMGLLEEAATSLKRTLYLEPDFIMAHFSLANLMLQQGDTGESRKYFKNALSLLRNLPPGATVEGSDGVTAERLIEIIETTGK